MEERRRPGAHGGSWCQNLVFYLFYHLQVKIDIVFLFARGMLRKLITKWFCTISILFAWDTYNVCTSNLKVLGSFWSRVTCATCDGVQECSLCRRPGENWTISLQLWELTTIVREVFFSFEMLKTQCNCAKIITTPGNVKPSKLERHRQLSDVAKGRRLKFGIFCHLFDGD